MQMKQKVLAGAFVLFGTVLSGCAVGGGGDYVRLHIHCLFVDLRI